MKPINKPLIRRVLKYIKSDLRRLEMNTYGQRLDADYKNAPPCGTQACFAGWTVLLNTPKSKWNSLFDFYGEMAWDTTHEKGRKLLGFTTQEAYEVFTGGSTLMTGAKTQYKQLVKDINEVLKNRGLKPIEG